MRKIAWITADPFIDHDFPILKAFKNDKQFEIEWYIIFTRIRVNTYNPIDIEKELGNGTIKFRYLYLNHRISSLYTLIKFLELILIIRKTKPEVIYIDGEFEPYFSILLKLILESNRVILAIHDVEPHLGISKIFHFFLSLKFKMFGNFHVFSHTQKDIFLLKYAKLKKNIFYAPVFLKNFGESQLTPPKDIVQFLFFGRIRKNKGLEYLIDATNKLTGLYKDQFIVKIVGKCDEWQIYEGLIKDFSVFDLSIEAMPNNKIADLFCQSHFLILPYKDVTQSGPLMIAFNYGVPAIASNLPGFVENIKDTVTGFLFETENSDSLYTIMKTVIDTHKTNYSQIKQNLNEYIGNNYSILKIKTMYSEMFNSELIGNNT